MTNEAFRNLALSMPDAAEGSHQGHADFRVGGVTNKKGRIFATLVGLDDEFGEDHAMVKLSPEQQRDLVEAHPMACFPAKGAWGVGGATMLRLKLLNAHTARRVVEMAWRNANGRD